MTMSGEKQLRGEEMSARAAIAAEAANERQCHERAGRRVPTQEQMERVYRDAVVRQERRKKG